MSWFNSSKSKENNSKYQLGSPKKISCDLSKTEKIIEILKTPKESRDTIWRNTFFENIVFASFSESIPQIIFGQDTFPYFVLKTDEHFNPFEAYCIGNMKDSILLRRGIGVIINPGKNTSEWTFSYGDILNLHLNNEFISNSETNHISANEKNENHSEIQFMSPPENYLPEFSRSVIKFFLQKNGIKKPKVIMTFKKNGDRIDNALLFNIFSEDFPSNEKFNELINQVKWFLPKHYVINSITKKSDWVKKLEDL